MDFRGIKEFIKDTFGYFVVIVVVMIICAYIVTLQQNIGDSMSPTLSNGDVFLLDKISYNFKEIKRNDVIAFKFADTKYLVKRVIGMPGERIDYKNNILYINGKAYDELFLDEDVITDEFIMEQIKGCDDGVIPENSYFVLGDNRGNSLDSRAIGVISKEDIIGRTSFRIFPFNKIGFIK